MTPASALDKFLKSHRRTCAVYIFSGDRHCSCGRDAAVKELEALRAQEVQMSLWVPMEVEVNHV